jgi:alkylation response protein AidB-like acyl-CoA dehydrogenase
VDTRYTAEQTELRRTACQLARELGPRTVVDLDDGKRARRLAEAVRDAGWHELRRPGEDGDPLASGVEAALIADALGEAVADVAFTGPVLAADLARRAGVDAAEDAVVGFGPDLIGPAIVPNQTTTDLAHAVDCAAQGSAIAYVLAPEGDRYRLAQLSVDGAREGADLTRAIRTVPAGARVSAVAGAQLLTRADLEAWAALGLALTSADLVGIMRGAIDLSVAYAQQRRQYGVAIGTFQAVQHLLAEARCLMEGAFSAALYPAWAVDALGADEARMAGRVAKAYCARAARSVCETAVQVHGGMGNTWECMVHVYLRRALLSSRWFGDDGEQLRQLQQTRLGVRDGLS